MRGDIEKLSMRLLEFFSQRYKASKYLAKDGRWASCCWTVALDPELPRRQIMKNVVPQKAVLTLSTR